MRWNLGGFPLKIKLLDRLSVCFCNHGIAKFRHGYSLFAGEEKGKGQKEHVSVTGACTCLLHSLFETVISTNTGSFSYSLFNCCPGTSRHMESSNRRSHFSSFHLGVSLRDWGLGMFYWSGNFWLWDPCNQPLTAPSYQGAGTEMPVS